MNNDMNLIGSDTTIHIKNKHNKITTHTNLNNINNKNKTINDNDDEKTIILYTD